MTRFVAARLAAALALAAAPGGVALAAGPFQEVPLPPPVHSSHTWSNLTLIAGAGLIGASFALSRRADESYDAYLLATDPDRIGDLYDRTITYDRLSSGSLLAGEAFLAAGVYFRFLTPPHGAHASLQLSPRRCGLSLGF